MKILFSKVNNHQRFTLFFSKALALALLCFSLSSCKQENSTTSFADIIERGYITVGTLYGPTTYYSDKDEYSGFEYELMKKYADSLGVSLKVIPSYSLDSLFHKLDNAEVDFLAAGLSITDERLENFRFAPSYQSVVQKLVFKQGKDWPRTIENLEGKLLVTANSSFVENLLSLKAKYPNLTWDETEELDTEELLLKILSEEIDYTIVDSNNLAVNRRFYPEISIGFSINKEEKLGWMLSLNSDDALLSSLVEFFGKVHQDGTLFAMNNKYYGHIQAFDYVETRTFIKAVETILPEYQDFFEKYALDIDWRLLAAISYQESHWKPHARSATGVRGMMMLTLPTAKQMGIKNRLDAEQSILGGAKYFKRMLDKIPDRISNPDRIWFALASYNIGFGHLNDARIITQQQGGDADRWVDVKTRLPLLQQKKFYKNTKYGYARGSEPVSYVENIRRYYDTLTWLDKKSDVAQN
ncbi:MAG: membrane-bound lytic murein transglycosylase MltF [Colwellia sp.]